MHASHKTSFGMAHRDILLHFLYLAMWKPMYFLYRGLNKWGCSGFSWGRGYFVNFFAFVFFLRGKWIRTQILRVPKNKLGFDFSQSYYSSASLIWMLVSFNIASIGTQHRDKIVGNLKGGKFHETKNIVGNDMDTQYDDKGKTCWAFGTKDARDLEFYSFHYNSKRKEKTVS